MVDMRKCKYCGEEFTVKYKSIKKDYCSHKCANNATINSRRKRTKIICRICGKEFEVVNSSIPIREKKGKIQYCSKVCMGIGMRKRKTINCLNCGKEFETTRNKFCCPQCACSFRKGANPGDGYWYENGYRVLWNGGNPIKEHIKVMEEHIGRKITKNEIVHHINEIKDDNSISNLVLMSRKEHSSYHRKKEIAEGKAIFGRLVCLIKEKDTAV